jgi:hypothetical protein
MRNFPRIIKILIDIIVNSYYNKSGGDIIMNSPGKRTQVTLRLPKELAAEVTMMADKMGVSKNAYILILISQALKKMEQTA